MARNENPTDIYGCRVHRKLSPQELEAERQRCAALARWASVSRESTEAEAEALCEMGVRQDSPLGTMGYDR